MRHCRFLGAVIVALTLASANPWVASAVDDADTPATALRIEFDRLLSEHVFLTVQAMHAGLRDDDQFAAAAEALEANTSDLEAAIRGIYGDAGGQRFGDLWRAHIGFVVDYTRARSASDEAAAQRAIDGLDSYQDDFAAFLADANPELSEESVHHLLEDHLGQLQQVAELQSGDYAAVYGAAMQTYRHMFEFGDALSQAIVGQFPDRFTGQSTAFGPAIDLRVALDQLLGEHAFLAIEVMRQAEDGADADLAASEALASNGASLRAAIEDIYGDDAGREFADVWEEHNGYYIDFVRALVDGDGPGQGRARAGMDEFAGRLATFFVSANDLLDPDSVRQGLDVHTDQLVRQVEAFGAGEYVEAFGIGREAYHHMSALSDVLATGIAHQFPERFLPDTALMRTAAPASVDLRALGLLALATMAVFASRLSLNRGQHGGWQSVMDASAARYLRRRN